LRMSVKLERYSTSHAKSVKIGTFLLQQIRLLYLTTPPGPGIGRTENNARSKGRLGIILVIPCLGQQKRPPIPHSFVPEVPEHLGVLVLV
jgi:hypothetical protein